MLLSTPPKDTTGSGKRPKDIDNSKNVSQKVNSRSIAIIPTKLICELKANSSGVEFLRMISKFKCSRSDFLSVEFMLRSPDVERKNRPA